jgi:hypothetical protein
MGTVSSTKILKIKYFALAMMIDMSRLNPWPVASPDEIAIR